MWRNSVEELVTEQYLLLQELHRTANVKGGLKKADEQLPTIPFVVTFKTKKFSYCLLWSTFSEY